MHELEVAIRNAQVAVAGAGTDIVDSTIKMSTRIHSAWVMAPGMLDLLALVAPASTLTHYQCSTLEIQSKFV